MRQSIEQSRSSLAMRLHSGEQGEGVISAAIAVLVMAFLGALMWAGFQLIYNEAEDSVREQVREIGS
jgi:hypothetical protein